MSLVSQMCNCALMLSGVPARLRFHAHRNSVKQTQRNVLFDILRRSAKSAYGKHHGFSSIQSVSEFLRCVPVIDYEDVSGQICLIRDGEQGVLTEERIMMLEPTSGSTAASKYIPYTASLQAQIQKAVGAWLFDLYVHRPRLLRGRAYFCVTPLAPPTNGKEDGIPLGYQDDTEYFKPFSAFLLRRQLVVPAELAQLQSSENFFYVTLLFLVAARDLSLISVWSPSYLTRLLQQLPRYVDRLERDLAQGTLSLIETENSALEAQLAARIKVDPRRARELAGLAQTAGVCAGTDEKPRFALEELGTLVRALWPCLAFISAWGDGVAADSVSEMRMLFPEVEFQPKGLLATEGVVSIPLSDHPDGTALAIDSHFFEFETENGELMLADQLAHDQVYSVRLTTGGGLYRYRLGDRVRVTGFYGQIPLLRFEGRTHEVSDWYGEKLNQYHVAQIVRETLPAGTPPTSLVLALERRPQPRYVLWTEASHGISKDNIAELEAMLDQRLRENHHYDLCRRTGQLTDLEIKCVTPGSITQAITRRALQEGYRLGTQKAEALDRRADWALYFINQGAEL